MSLSHNESHFAVLPFLDMFMNMLLGVFMLFVLAFLLINPAEESTPVPPLDAQYLIRLTWENEPLADVDLHLLLPDSTHMFFGNRDHRGITLDRDDLGQLTDSGIYQDDLYIEENTNIEVIFIRTPSPGRYVVNLHLFERYAHGNSLTPIKIQVTLERVHPYSTVIRRQVEMIQRRSEMTVFSFTITENGEVTNITSIDTPFLANTFK